MQRMAIPPKLMNIDIFKIISQSQNGCGHLLQADTSKQDCPVACWFEEEITFLP